jgi:copper(I)-binding protein
MNVKSTVVEIKSRKMKSAKQSRFRTAMAAVLTTVLSLAAHGGAAADTGQAVGIEVNDAWIRWLPTGFPGAGYMTVTNIGSTEQVLIGADSPDYGTISFHQTHMKGGMSGMSGMNGMSGMTEMTPVASVILKPHATVRFAEGGYHLMLMQPRRTLHPGDHVLVTLRFADGRALVVPFEVREGS